MVSAVAKRTFFRLVIGRKLVTRPLSEGVETNHLRKEFSSAIFRGKIPISPLFPVKIPIFPIFPVKIPIILLYFEENIFLKFLIFWRRNSHISPIFWREKFPYFSYILKRIIPIFLQYFEEIPIFPYILEKKSYIFPIFGRKNFYISPIFWKRIPIF